jgi:hypothetical protein
MKGRPKVTFLSPAIEPNFVLGELGQKLGYVISDPLARRTTAIFAYLVGVASKK